MQFFPEFELKRTRELMLNMKSVLTGLIHPVICMGDVLFPESAWSPSVEQIHIEGGGNKLSGPSGLADNDNY